MRGKKLVNFVSKYGKGASVSLFLTAVGLRFLFAIFRALHEGNKEEEEGNIIKTFKI